MNSLDAFQQSIQYKFHNLNILKNALTHSSYCYEQNWKYTRCNERLEYLGDAVLELISSEHLYQTYPDLTEGELSKLRSQLVCESNLAACARKINLSQYLSLGKGEKKSGGENRDSLLCDALEAMIGAIYLDSGYDSAKEFTDHFILSEKGSNQEGMQIYSDGKTSLQEYIQGKMKNQGLIRYQVDKESGPDHDKVYECSCYIGTKKYASGKGKSKKAAEQVAAYKTLELLKKEEKV
ncbi:MAG: ribonuclease III [Lachnoclostridium sp.]|jgi:ribonuclease-3|nr:ribonuclease III [Lachnoclostridium sp.]